MANEQNLKSLATRTQRERKEIASKGQKASTEAKKEKKIFKEAIAERMGYKDFEEMIDNLIDRAKNNDKSFEVLRDTLGQKPTEEMKINAVVNDPFDELSVEELKKLANEQK